MFIFLRCLIIYQYCAAVKLALIMLLTSFYFNPFEQISYGVVLPIIDLRLKLRNGLQRIHICIFYQNINKNFLIKMLYVL